jgi:hypothetical protein
MKKLFREKKRPESLSVNHYVNRVQVLNTYLSLLPSEIIKQKEKSKGVNKMSDKNTPKYCTFNNLLHMIPVNARLRRAITLKPIIKIIKMQMSLHLYQIISAMRLHLPRKFLHPRKDPAILDMVNFLPLIITIILIHHL